MTDETVIVIEEKTAPQTPFAKARAKAKPKKKTSPKKTAKRVAKKPVSKRSSKPASVRPKKRGKAPGHWSDTHAQLVIHAHPSLIAKLDRKIAKLGKLLKLDKPTRGSIVRALVEKACR